MQIKLQHLPNDDTYISYGYGLTPTYFSGKKFHNGVDIKAKTRGVAGDPIYAAADGKVVVSKFNEGGYGWYVIVDHAGFSTVYGHLNKQGVSVGTTVKAGDRIASMGSTGNSSGPHLHFEIQNITFTGNSSVYFSYNAAGVRVYGEDPTTYINSLINKSTPHVEPEKEIIIVDDKTHWAYPIFVQLNEAGIKINEMRFSEQVTRGEMMAMILSLAKAQGLIKE